MKKNYFPTTLVDKCNKTLLHKQLAQKIVEHSVPKKKLFVVLPYLGMSFLCLKTHLQKSINNISFCKIKTIFKSSTWLGIFFGFTDKIPLSLRSNGCHASYYSETCQHFKTRIGKHSDVSPLKNKKSKSKKSSAVKDHMLMWNQLVFFDNFKVLASSNSEFHLKIKESLLISRELPIFNKSEASLSLYLFN